MIKRIVAVAFIVFCASLGWMYLSSVMDRRSWEAGQALSDSVGGLWGTTQNQTAPITMIEWEEAVKRQPGEKRSGKAKKVKQNSNLQLSGSDIKVNLWLEYRKKGLLWFSTYTSEFEALYAIENPLKVPVTVTMTFPLPSDSAVYDRVKILAEGREDLKYTADAKQIVATFKMDALSSQTVEFGYASRGLDQWKYSFGTGTDMVQNFKLSMRTNFNAIDFPRDTVSPDLKTQLPDGKGWKLEWRKGNTVVSNFGIGMIMPRLINPGPLASAMSFHAPVSLLFFFFLIFILQTPRNLKIHPMNYFFLACSFFAFNLLLSYLVDHLDLKNSFIISSAVSILLVVSYIKRVAGTRFALIEAGMSQFLFQILFSFAHFFEGYTGLAITIGAIVTLAVVMHLTAKINWEEKFKDKEWGTLSKRTKLVIPSAPKPPPMPKLPPIPNAQ